MSKKRLTCFCEHTFEVDFPEQFSIDKTPETLEQILDGSFMSFTCPNCGKVLKPEFSFLLTDTTGDIEIAFIPEEQRAAYMNGKESFPETKRVVIGYKELVEKIKIMKNNLDDRVIEIIKFYLLQKAEQEIEHPDILFNGFDPKDPNSLIFHIHDLQSDQLGVIPIPFSFYEKNLSSLPEKVNDEQFQDILTPPYISIKKIDIGEG